MNFSPIPASIFFKVRIKTVIKTGGSLSGDRWQQVLSLVKLSVDLVSLSRICLDLKNQTSKFSVLVLLSRSPLFHSGVLHRLVTNLSSLLTPVRG